MEMRWNVSIGDVVAVVTIISVFVKFHFSNKETIRKNSEDLKRNSEDLQDMKTKLGIIYSWFEKNIIGRVAGD